MLNIDKLPGALRQVLRHRVGASIDSDSHDDQIRAMTPLEAFDHYLQYLGLVGYTDRISKVWDGLCAAEEQPEPDTAPKCEVCGAPEVHGVCSVPGVPYSAAYCRPCLEKDLHPMWILIANTASIGGLDQAAPWWREMVEHNLKGQDKTLEWFNEQVAENIRAVAEKEAS